MLDGHNHCSLSDQEPRGHLTIIMPVDNTVGPLYKGHIGTSKFVHCREVVHSSEVKNVLAL